MKYCLSYNWFRTTQTVLKKKERRKERKEERKKKNVRKKDNRNAQVTELNSLANTQLISCGKKTRLYKHTVPISKDTNT
jgi:hypothetical protein